MLYDFILGDNIALGMEMPILHVLIGEMCEDRGSDYTGTYLIVVVLAIHVMVMIMSRRHVRVPRVI
jgi:bacteriorhodopsin